jgi:hypothetical protein
MRLVHLPFLSLVALSLTACIMTEIMSKPKDKKTAFMETPEYNQEEKYILTYEASWFPNVYISASGKLVQGLVSFNDRLCYYGFSRSTDIAPLTFPESLRIEAGNAIEILVTGKSEGAALIVTELNMLGIPITSSVLKIVNSKIPYVPTSKENIILQLTVQHSWNQFETYLFKIDIIY